ncbi:MAG TPA: hypothetical protein EYO20_00430, partial [Gemmatimonadetes bacterium]|nr:hypothetical protein [Gemmatimonadota bacterium]
MGENNETRSGIERRDFLMAAAAAAAGAVHPLALEALDPTFSRWIEQQQEAAPPIPLGQGEHPALVFQAYPGGTGSLMEKLWREHGPRMFERSPIRVLPWRGVVPESEEDIAFLPVHRLSALMRARRISSVDLTEIYLDRIKRYDPILLCAVTILEDRAREEAQQADTDLRRGNWRGPLHGIPYGVK